MALNQSKKKQMNIILIYETVFSQVINQNLKFRSGLGCNTYTKNTYTVITEKFK